MDVAVNGLIRTIGCIVPRGRAFATATKRAVQKGVPAVLAATFNVIGPLKVGPLRDGFGRDQGHAVVGRVVQDRVVVKREALSSTVRWCPGIEPEPEVE